MLLYWLWLANRPGVSDGVKSALVRHFPSPEDIFFGKKQDLEALEITGLSQEALDSLMDHNLEREEAILSDCARLGIGLLTMEDSAYPDRLKNIYDPPLVLYYKGTLPEMDSLPTVAVVGTRHASVYGLQMAGRMGRELAEGGALVVSGLADGIDSAAMQGALGAGVPVVGVLGCGADVVYPRKNKELYKLTERQGCILTEYAPGTPPLKWNFPRRNRIISGLSCGVVVVEAPARSGSLLTARQATDQGRDVFVIPGNVDMESFVGSNRLLRSGAVAVSCGQDVLGEYQGIYPGKLSAVAPAEPLSPPEPVKKEPPKKKLTGKTIDKVAEPPYIDGKESLAGLSPEEQAVLAAIGQQQRLVDDVIAETALSSGKVLSILTMLELKGKITRLPGKRIARR